MCTILEDNFVSTKASLKGGRAHISVCMGKCLPSLLLVSIHFTLHVGHVEAGVAPVQSVGDMIKVTVLIVLLFGALSGLRFFGSQPIM